MNYELWIIMGIHQMGFGLRSWLDSSESVRILKLRANAIEITRVLPMFGDISLTFLHLWGVSQSG